MRMRFHLAGLAALLLAALPAVAAPGEERPLVIAHRGASGYLPEETLAAYRLALSMRADFLEGDVFLTADGVAVMRHDRALNATTDVAEVAARDPEIAALRSPDNTFDVTRFTLAQLRRLSATCRAAAGYCTDRTHMQAGAREPIATYAEFLDLAHAHFRATGEAVGVYPEAKGGGVEVARAILDGLHDPRYEGYFTTPGRALTQSFDAAQVAYLNANSSVPVTYLGVCPADAAAASAIAAVADGIGPSIARMTPDCVRAAKAAGLTVMPYTFLADPAPYRAAYALGVDGVFTNYPDLAARLRDARRAGR